MEITKNLVHSLAPDAASVATGDKLVKKNSFGKLFKDKDETVIFGECSGSGANPYVVSVDFINPEAPIARCNCPSRKIPCKHALGLMIAYAEKKSFAVAEIPEDILSKRGKIQKRDENKEKKLQEALDGEAKPKKINMAALQKKIASQLEGLDIAQNLLSKLVRDGMGAITPKASFELEKQAKQMEDHYLTGIQKSFVDLAYTLSSNEDREATYTSGYEQIVRLYALLKKGRDYLQSRYDNPETPMDIETDIEALLGFPWKLTELLEAGLGEKDATLAQLAFSSYDNEVLKQNEEVGVWINFSSGQVVKTINIRPYKALKYIQENDSTNNILTTSLLYKYPGGINPRVRWDGFSLREMTDVDHKKLLSFAGESFAPVLKEVKAALKTPLSDKNPFIFVRYKTIGEVSGELVIEDAEEERIVLSDADEKGWLNTIGTIHTIGEGVNSYNACLLRLKYAPDKGEFSASPFALLNEKSILKLGF